MMLTLLFLLPTSAADDAAAQAALALAAAARERAPTPKVATATPKVAPKVAQPLPAGWHQHKCPHCGTVWGHGAASYGNRAAHTCPKCGAVQWNRADGRSDAPQAAAHCPT